MKTIKELAEKINTINERFHYYNRRLWELENPPEFKYGDKAYVHKQYNCYYDYKKVKILKCKLETNRNDYCWKHGISKYDYRWIYTVADGKEIYETFAVSKTKS